MKRTSCFAAALILSACVDSTSKPAEPLFDPVGCDSAADPANPAAQFCTHLAAVSPLQVPIRGYTTDPGAEAELVVRWTNKAGDPIATGDVVWTLVDVSGVSGASLVGATSHTDGDGQASMVVRPGNRDASFQVRATTASAPEVVFRINVVSKDAGSLTAHITYEGAYEPGVAELTVDVRVFRRTALAGCAAEDLDPYDDNSLPTAEQTATLQNTPDDARFEGFLRGDRLTTVAFLRRSGVALAWGCASDITIQAGQADEVSLALSDLVPRYAGIYDVTSNLDFLGLLPGDEVDGTEARIREIGNLFANPGEQIVSWLRDIEEVEELLDGLPAVATSLLQDLLDSLLERIFDRLPEGIQRIRTGGADFFDILTDLQLRSELEFGQEPSPVDGSSTRLAFPRCGVGALAPEACPQKERWVALGFDWRLSALCANNNDNNCDGYREYDLAAYELQQPNGVFNASVANFWQLSVETHTLTVDWGGLVVFVLEKMLLPLIFGPEIDTLDAMIYRLVGGEECLSANDPRETCCENLANWDLIKDQPNFIRSGLRSACRSGVHKLPETIRKRINKLDFVEENNFEIGTSDQFAALPEAEQHSCTLHDGLGDGSGVDLRVSTLGREGEADRCHWRMGLSVEGEATDLIEATFHGVIRP